VPRPTYLSEEDEAAELATQDRLREVESRARALQERRYRTVAEADRLTGELEALRKVWSAKEREVGDARHAFREIGGRLDELRAERTRARAQIEELRAKLGALPRPKGETARLGVERIRRQILDLQVRQQTVALSLPDENAIIDRIRELQRTFATAEAGLAAEQKERGERAAVEKAIREAQAQTDRLAEEAARLHALRRSQFESIRARREAEQGALGALRDKVRARDALDASVKTLSGQLTDCEGEIRGLLRESRDRRREARETLHEFGRRARPPEGAPADQAERQLSDLLRNGKIRLGG
jgi:uncharacterized coiled-coil DUF342 family protein